MNPTTRPNAFSTLLPADDRLGRQLHGERHRLVDVRAPMAGSDLGTLHETGPPSAATVGMARSATGTDATAGVVVAMPPPSSYGSNGDDHDDDYDEEKLPYDDDTDDDDNNDDDGGRRIDSIRVDGSTTGLQSSTAATDMTANGVSRRRVYRSRYDDFTTIDWIHDFSLDRRRAIRFSKSTGKYPSFLGPGSRLFRWFPGLLSRDEVVRYIRTTFEVFRRSWNAAEGWLIVTAIGVSIGVLAAFVEICTSWLSDLRHGYCRLPTESGDFTSGWYLNRQFCCWELPLDQCPYWHPWIPNEFLNFFLYTFFALLMAAFSFLLVQTYAPYASSSGLPEVRTILGGFVIHRFLGVWTGIIKSLAVVFSVASGLTLGTDAPMVHIACCFGNVFPRLFSKYQRNEAKKREILSAAAAAGISVAFGAPLAGVLFSLEEASSYFPQKTLWRSFFCSIVAAFVLQAMNPFRTGKLVLFQTTYDRDWRPWEVFCFASLGILGGIYGVVFIRLNKAVATLRRQHNFWIGQHARWKDWFAWIPWTSGAADPAPIISVETPASVEEQFSSASSRRWWNPSKVTIRRCFQELVWISLLTSVVSYGNLFMRGDMPNLLAGVLRECKNDAILIGRQTPKVPTPIPPPPPFTPIGNSSLVGFIEAPISFFRTPDVVIAEDEDIFRLCYNTSEDAYSFGGVLTQLLITAVIRFGLAVITFGLRVPGGVYIPTMVVGACIGRVMGMLVRAAVGSSTVIITPGTYALVGAASFLGGVTRLTVTIVVMMFEITGGGALTFVVPIMIALMAAKFVGDALDRDGLGSITDMYIRFHGYPLLDLKRDFFQARAGARNGLTLQGQNEPLLAKDVMAAVEKLVVIPVFASISTHVTPYAHTVGSISELLERNPYQGYPLVQSLENPVPAGYIRRNDLRMVLMRARKSYGISEEAPCYFFSDTYPFRVLHGEYSSAVQHRHVESPVKMMALDSSHVDPFEKVQQFRYFINFSAWVDTTPVAIPAIYPMDLALELFKKLGMRYVLVVQEANTAPEATMLTTLSTARTNEPGALVGLMTKKDVLRAMECRDAGETAQSPREEQVTGRRRAFASVPVTETARRVDEAESFIDVSGNPHPYVAQ